jgi:microcystin-dependent protein
MKTYLLIIILALTIFVIYCSCNNKETFSNPTPAPIIIDNESNNNLNSIATNLMTSNGIICPGNANFDTDMEVNGIDILPIGSIIAYAGSSLPSGILSYSSNPIPPSGWMWCDGSSYSKSDYPELYSVIGLTFGSNVPDLRSRTIIGSNSTYPLGSVGGEEQHTLTIDEMAQHTHTLNDISHNHTYPQLSTTGNCNDAGGSSLASSIRGYTNIANSTSTSNGAHTHTMPNDGTSLPHNNMQPYTALNYIIRVQ